MGQAEVLNVLNEHKGKRFTTRQVAEMMETKPNNISVVVSKLIRYRLVEHTYIDYRCGKRLQLIWVPDA